MRVGYIVYSDSTECEFVCVHECLAKVIQLGYPDPPENRIIGVSSEVLGWNGIRIVPDLHYSAANQADFDLLVVPGGWASRTVRYDVNFMAWLKRWDRAKPIAACCSGALILAEAGFLDGRRATTHSLAMKQLAEYPRVTVVKQRVVDEGDVVTAGGIMAAFDLGLHLVERFWGTEARRAVAHQDEYRDVQAHPKLQALLPELDHWYEGGHIDVMNRPAGHRGAH